MKKLLLLLLTPYICFAGEKITTEMYCDDTKVIVKTLRETYREEPFILGKADDVAGSVMTLWLNPLSKTWTIMATSGDFSCIVGVGSNIQLIPLKNKTHV